MSAWLRGEYAHIDREHAILEKAALRVYHQRKLGNHGSQLLPVRAGRARREAASGAGGFNDLNDSSDSSDSSASSDYSFTESDARDCARPKCQEQ